VYWGDQTWEEMMIGFYDYIDLAPTQAGEPAKKKDPQAEGDKVLAEPQASAN